MVRITFATANDSFANDFATEVAAMLRDVSKRIADGVTAGNIRDTNGNTIGSFIAIPEDE